MATCVKPFASSAGYYHRQRVINSLVGYHKNLTADNLIKRDVFLNQEFIDCDNAFNDIYKHFQDFDSLDTYEDDYKDLRDNFTLFLDNLCALESTEDTTSKPKTMFGCICCQSCQMKSKDFLKTTNQMLDDFRRQLSSLKNDVRQELAEINSQLNQTRLHFAKLLVDLQTKMNEKNNRLDKILDLSKLLSQTNDYLLNDNKQTKNLLENVCKENIIYRNRLGIDLKVTLSRNECKKYYQQMKRRKKEMKDQKNDAINSDVKSESQKFDGMNVTTIVNTVNDNLRTTNVVIKKETMNTPIIINDFVNKTTTTPSSSKTTSHSSPQVSPNMKTYSNLGLGFSRKSPVRLKNGLNGHRMSPLMTNKLKESNNYYHIHNNNHLNSNSSITAESLRANYCNIFTKYYMRGTGDNNNHKLKSNETTAANIGGNDVNRDREESTNQSDNKSSHIPSPHRINGKHRLSPNDNNNDTSFMVNKKFRENCDRNK